MRISSKIVEAIHDSASSHIVDIIGDYVNLKRRGSNYIGLSPFKIEKTPSFVVSPAKGIFKCFSTGKGGSAITFLRELEGLSYQEALTAVAQKLGITLEYTQQTVQDDSLEKKKDSLFSINEFAAAFFQKQMESSEGKTEAISYWENRGLHADTVKKFRLGYAPVKSSLTSQAIQEQYNTDLLLELGLALKRDDQSLIDRFRGRVMFPIQAVSGKIIGFAGRITKKNDEVAKYINSPDSVIYHKSEALFGLFQAKESIRKQNVAILTEGYLDVIQMHQSEITNVVASCGTALTQEQARLIKRYAGSVLILYDGDEAGKKAAFKAVDILLEVGLTVKVLFLPNNEDPDSFIQKNGSEPLKELLTQTIPGLYFKLDILKEQYPSNDPDSKAQIVKELAESLVKIPDELQQGLYMEDLAGKLGVPVQLFKISMNKIQQKQFKQDEKRQVQHYTQTTTVHENIDRFSKLKQKATTRILKVLANCPDLEVEVDGEKFKMADAIFVNELEQFFDSEMEKELYLMIKNWWEQKENKLLDKLFLFAEEKSEYLPIVIDLIDIPIELSEGWKHFEVFTPEYNSNSEDLYKYVKKFELAVLMMECRKMEYELKNFELAVEQQEKLLLNKMRLDQLRKKLAVDLGIVIQSIQFDFQNLLG